MGKIKWALILLLSCTSKDDQEYEKALRIIQQSERNYQADSIAIENRVKLEQTKAKAE